MKKILAGIALILALTPVMVQPDAVDDLGRALANIAGLDTVGIEEELPRYLLPGTPEYRAMMKGRLEGIKRALDQDILTPEMAPDALVVFVAAWFFEFFDEFANNLAKVIEAAPFNDASAAAAIRKLPGAIVDSVLLLRYLIGQMVSPTEVRQKYLGHLLKLRDAGRCLLAKDLSAVGNCTSYKDAFVEVLENMSAVVLPIAQVMALGIKVPRTEIKGLPARDKIEGLLVQGANVLLPEMTENVYGFARLFELLLDSSDHIAQSIKKEDSKRL